MSAAEAQFASIRLRARHAYAFAVAATGVVLLLVQLYPGTFGQQPPMVMFSIPIAFSAYLGGLRGGLAATAASCLTTSFFLSPLGWSGSRLPSFLVAIAGLVISVVVDTLHRTRRRGNVVLERQARSEHALRQSEERYEAIVRWSPEPILIHREGTVLFVNPAALAMFGADSSALMVGRHIRAFMHPDSVPLALQRIGEARAAATLPMVEMVARRLDGTTFGVEVHGRSIDIDGQRAQFTSLRDISVRQAHEAEIGRLNRMYSALSEINQAIVRMPSREVLFESVCRTLVDHGGVRAAWIDWSFGGGRDLAAASPGGDETVTLASAGTEMRIVGSAGSGADTITGCHEPSATAFREERPVIRTDMRALPGPPAWKESIERTGLRECAAFPIRADAIVRGTLTVATHERGFFQAQEIALLEEVARDVSFALDISLREGRRNDAEVALLLERDRFRSLFDYAPVGIIIADPSGRYIEVNDTMRTMIGYSRADLVGRDASLIVAPEEVPHIGPAVDAINSHADYRREWRFRRQDGSQFSAEVNSIAMPDGNILATIRDVTERNDATHAVRVAEERMRFALTSSKVGIWDMDYTTGALAWSETLEAQYGLEPHTFDGTLDGFMARVHPDDRRGLASTLDKAVMSGLDFTVENRALWTDGTVRFLRGAGRILLGEHGRPTRGIGISMDVTSQRILEEQFHQSQKMEAIGRLAGGVAHDFNNLLTVILGYCDLLKMELGADARQSDDVTEIQRAGRSAAELTRQLLAFSRKQIIEPMPVDLTATVRAVRLMLDRLLGDNIRIDLALDPHVGIITADRAQIEQVIVNLAVNARDAMPAGGTLTITTNNVSLDDEHAVMHLGVLPGAYVKLTVSDTGCGMPPEVQARLFEPFFTTKEVGKGTGLGLATVHGIIARNGGAVSVQSTVNVGTTFKVFFPIDDDAEIVVDSANHRSKPAVSGRTVLVVDDARSIRELTKRLAERLGYAVLVAGNADEALRAIAEHAEIDLVLTDVVMPGWSGIELNRRILALRPDIRVVLMSGYADDTMALHGVLASEVSLLKKPFTYETLETSLSEAFGR